MLRIERLLPLPTGHFKFICFSQNSHEKDRITLTVTIDKFDKILLNLVTKIKNKSF